MELKALKCPICGGQINIEIKNSNTIFCPYCGNQIDVEGNKLTITENINIQTRHTDEARLLEAQIKHKEKEQSIIEAKKSSRRYLVAMLIIFGLMQITSMIRNNETTKAVEAGKIKIGMSAYEMENKKYKGIKETLETEGFTNITLIDLDDADFFKNKKDTIDHVSIDGDTSFSSSDYFYPDAKIIISYH